jgi:hypothetical protein
MRFVFVGVPELHQGVASAVLRNPPKNLYHHLQNGDGIFEQKEIKEKEMSRVNLFCSFNALSKVLKPDLHLLLICVDESNII